MSLTCKDVMGIEQSTLRPADTVSTAFHLMRQKGIRFLPVVAEDGTYIGVFTSPTLIKLLLPRAITIQMSGKGSRSLSNLGFYHVDEEDFHDSLAEEKDEPVINHLSDPDNIPIVSPDTPMMEGILLLHKYKRHVIVVEPKTGRFVGVVSINSVLKKIFDKDHEL